MYVGLHAKGNLFLSDWYQTYIFWRDVSKTSPLYNFQKSLSSGIQIEPCGLTDRHEKANTFCDFAYVPKTVRQWNAEQGSMMFPRTVNSVAHSTQSTMDKQHIFYLCNISCIVTSIEL
jgi:hypothetical protein